MQKKNLHFCHVQFSLDKKHIRKNTCLKQHACLVDSLGDLKKMFVFPNFHVLFDLPKKCPNHEKWPNLAPFFELSSPFAQGPIPIQKVSPTGAHSEFWRGSKGSGLDAHPVFQDLNCCLSAAICCSIFRFSDCPPGLDVVWL